MVRYLIVNADDLGISAGVNQGILETYLHGIVTSTTAMMNLPEAPAGIHLLHQKAPRIGIGLHITLTHGKPLLPPAQVRSLVRGDGSFYPLAEFIERNTTFDHDELYAEINAQYERFVQVAGRKPDHLDAHHYVLYLNPHGFDILLRLAGQHGLPIRSARESLSLAGLRDMLIRRGYPQPVNDTLPQALLDACANNPRPRWPDYTERGFYRDGANLDTLLHILRNLREGVTELMCHPGYVHDLDEAYKAPREVELRALTHASVRQVIAQEGIRLITFGHLAQVQGT